MKIEHTEWGIVNPYKTQVLYVEAGLNEWQLQMAFAMNKDPGLSSLYGAEFVWKRLEADGYRCVRVTLTAEVEG